MGMEQVLRIRHNLLLCMVFGALVAGLFMPKPCAASPLAGARSNSIVFMADEGIQAILSGKGTK
jgi:hypothetical protein